MYYFVNDSRDPCYNQAFEEFIFNNFTGGDILLLWRSDPAVICGRYQNVFAEVNVPAAKAAGITLVRRETGGGTVYHDHGNLNYTLISDYDGEGADYERFLQPVAAVLRSMGVPAETGRICDIAVEGKKVSGSAQKIAGSRVLHHGTLLFSADLATLRQAANGGRAEYVSKGVASSPWPVVNLQTYLPGMTIEDFQKAMYDGLTEGKSVETLTLPPEMLSAVRELAERKYRAWDWTFGKNPAYTLTRATPGGTLVLGSRRGIVERLTLDGQELPAGMRLDVDELREHPLFPYLF